MKVLYRAQQPQAMKALHPKVPSAEEDDASVPAGQSFTETVADVFGP